MPSCHGAIDHAASPHTYSLQGPWPDVPGRCGQGSDQLYTKGYGKGHRGMGFWSGIGDSPWGISDSPLGIGSPKVPIGDQQRFGDSHTPLARSDETTIQTLY